MSEVGRLLGHGASMRLAETYRKIGRRTQNSQKTKQIAHEKREERSKSSGRGGVEKERRQRSGSKGELAALAFEKGRGGQRHPPPLPAMHACACMVGGVCARAGGAKVEERGMGHSFIINGLVMRSRAQKFVVGCLLRVPCGQHVAEEAPAQALRAAYGAGVAAACAATCQALHAGYRRGWSMHQPQPAQLAAHTIREAAVAPCRELLVPPKQAVPPPHGCGRYCLTQTALPPLRQQRRAACVLPGGMGRRWSQSRCRSRGHPALRSERCRAW